MTMPQATLKVVVFIHFIFTVWGTMNPFLGYSYIYMNLFVLSLGVWSIVHHESSDAVIMFLACHVFSILQDIILLGINEPRGYRSYEENPRTDGTTLNEYRFTLGMSIVNLILKPITAFLLFRIYRERGGSYSEFNIPGVGNLPSFGGSQGGGNYEDIDEPVPTNNPHHNEASYNEEKPPLHQSRCGSQGGGNYEDIDEPVPTNNPHHNEASYNEEKPPLH